MNDSSSEYLLFNLQVLFQIVGILNYFLFSQRTQLWLSTCFFDDLKLS